MARLSQLLEHQKRFVRDSSHQLRTPLAVLKTQVQSALRGDIEPRLALEEIAQTVQGATELANQMLALAKVEQLRQQDDVPVSDWASIVHAVALDLSALVAEQALDFATRDPGRPVRATNGRCASSRATCCTTRSGSARRAGRWRSGWHCAAATPSCASAMPAPGSAAQRERMFQPFSTDAPLPRARIGPGSGDLPRASFRRCTARSHSRTGSSRAASAASTPG